jgi:uncharacterized protein (DUF488 family)
MKGQPMKKTGTIVSFGYANPGSYSRLYRLMAIKSTFIADIRLAPQSKYHPFFNQSSLKTRFGRNYIHIPELGNLNYKPEDREKGVKLRDSERGLARLIRGLEQGYTLVLLCACRNYEQCHRKTVIELLQSIRPDIMVDAGG